MSITLGEFLSELDAHVEPVDLDHLKSRLELLDLDPEEVGEYTRFSDDRYQRNLLRAGPSYHALIICWKNGQRSPIHDHRGSACGVRVLRGVASETIFHRDPDGTLHAGATSELPAGGVIGSFDSDIHELSNLQPGDADLVTLHIYSPPLTVMGTYSLADATRKEVVDPIFEFAAGAGI